MSEGFRFKEAQRYNTVLKESFPDGLRQNIIHVKKFINCYMHRYGTQPSVKREDLLKVLKEIGTVLDGRIYAKQEQRSYVEKLHREIAAVFDMGGSCICLRCLLERHRQELAQQLRIYNEDALQSLLLANGTHSYSVHNGYLQWKEVFPDSAGDVLSALRQSHLPMTSGQLQEKLWYLPLEKIKQALVLCDASVNVDRDTYFYAPNLPITPKELDRLTVVMGETLKEKGFLVAKDLRRLLEQYCPVAAIDIAPMKDRGLRNALGYLLRERFSIHGAIICRKGETVTAAEAYRSFCRGAEELTLSALKSFSVEIGQPINWRAVFDEMVRISPSELVKRERIHFDTAAADDVLNTLCPGDYLPIWEVKLFLQFPPIEVPWNAFVLEWYLLKRSKRFRLEQASASENNCYGAIVRNEALFADYPAIITDVLAHSTKWDNEKSALDLLVQEGYQATRQLGSTSKVVQAARIQREQLKRKK